MRRVFLLLLILLSIGVVNAFPLGYDNYKLIDAIPKGNIVDDRVYEDKVIRIEFDDFTGKYPQFTLRNISNTPLTILWDLCAFVDSTGRSQGVIRSNIPFLDRGKPVPPTLVIPRAFISEVMVPLDSIDYDGGWIVNNSIPKEAEQTLTIVLTVEQGGKQTTYMFTFESVMASRGVLVEGGTFTMGDTWGGGDSDERPTHKVTFTYDFYIGKYEVTFDEYDAFCNATGKSKASDSGWGRGTRPVINVTWWDAIDYCNWLSEKEKLPKAYDSDGNLLDKDGRITIDPSKVVGYRLPTEAEWEYAAKGGNKSEGYKYSGSDNVSDVAWYSSNSGSKTQEVGKKAPNELGLYDMSGNVWEWCSDWYGSYSSSAQTNPYNSTAGSYRVFRGGSWSNVATYTRVADRGSFSPSGTRYRLGFRICRTVP
ncbi:formylglycine-generating enzyme family protein [Acetomicrobium sp.]|uniref:formylglycine-generating enzyme family protein n=1 Tax=Acetomicrobium sp. TaxID=1872099 RepID=UPI001BCC1F00|nr:formylglycine-generating enzyme family protein [Acetomicrobium sp.]